MEYGPLVSCLSSPSWIWFPRQTLTLQGLGCSVPPLSAELRIFDMESQFDPVLPVAQSGASSVVDFWICGDSWRLCVVW